MSTISKELFEGLKERAVNCVNDPNCETIESLNQFISKCDNHFVNSLYQYSIFPLRLIISNLPQKQTNLDKTLISTVECLSLIFQKSRINRFDIFADLFTNLFHLIDDNPLDNELKFKPSEDLILSVIKCTKALIQCCDNSLVPQLISPSFSPQFGHSIHTLLNATNNQKYTTLRVEAIETIDCLISKCELNISKDSSKSCFQDLIAYFLPGISIQLSKLITSDDKLNRKVIISALNLFSHIIVCVFKDIPMGCESVSENCNNKNCTKETDNENPILYVIRDKNWLQTSCDKLLIIFDKITSTLISHQISNVRQALAAFVIKVLTNCSSLFTNKCLSVLLKVPLTYLSDESETLILECDSFVTKFSATNVSCDSSKSYLDIIEDQIYSYITSLPRLIRMGNERDKVTSIYLLYGYLKCLDKNGINYLVYSLQHKQKLFDCLIDICAFDDHGIRLLEQVSNAEIITHLDKQHSPHKWIAKSFKHLNNEKSVKAVIDCCQLIASRVEAQVLIDYLTDLLRQSKLNPSVLFVSNQLISNINITFNETEELIELYLSNINSIIEDKTIEQMNKDILRQCLLIEGLTDFLHLYDTKSSHNYLLISIFPLLESLGASNQSIFETSHRALTLVSKHFKYDSISALIANNMDYLVNWICINLKHFSDNQRVPIVIKAMLKFSTQDMLHLFVDAIDQIIVVLDSYYATQALPLMHVLFAFICTLNRYYLKNDEILTNPTNNYEKANCSISRSHKLLQTIEEFFENKKIVEDLEVDSEILDENQEQFDEESNKYEVEQKTNIPFYVTITEKILDRCLHIMSHSDSRVRLIVLDIVIEGLRLLKPFQDHLLPMAHKLWPALVERFRDKDVIVMKRSFSCLQIMSKTCGDFIRDRTVKEVFPRVLSFLRSQSKISFKKDKASAYRFTVGYQFQIDILFGIGQIAVDLDLRDKELWLLIVEIMPYLSTYQPIPLQESAIAALKTISQVDSCSIFYYLKMAYSSDNTITNNENNNFLNLTFGQSDKQFATNVTKLLDYLSFS